MRFWQRLLPGKKPPSQRAEEEPPRAKPVLQGRRTHVGWATDVGRVRTHNEDAILISEANQEGGESLLPFGLFVLADGMGGHRSGEVASALAARAVARHVVQQVYLATLSRREHCADQPSLSEVLTEAVNLANTAVSSAVPGAGTTLTCVLLIGRQAHIAHVGDSRAYLTSPDGLKQITRDHSLVDRLVEMGQLTAEEAASHPQKNVLYRAVGQSGVLEVETYLCSVPPGCSLLLCSDGLWSMVSDEKMARVIAEAPSHQAACETLVEAANELGGRDNITAILVRPAGEWE
ncbi:MAG: Stp1/IreP family PP2C-type Ser/Thr phosphatase [Anaerolineae bacterium]|jgi:serine/threonine protein phosphatase PrpC